MSKWIPVKNKRAKHPCLACDKFGQIFIPHGVITLNERCFDSENYNPEFGFDVFLRGEEVELLSGEKAYVLPREIIAWMPLPKPYIDAE